MTTISIVNKKSIYQSIILDLLSKMNKGSMRIDMYDGTTIQLGTNEKNISASISITHPDFFKKCVLYGDVGFGEAYVDGYWETNNITNVIKWFLLNIDNAPTLSGSTAKTIGLNFLKFFNKLSQLRKANDIDRAKENISEHYDLNNDFFKLFLDSSMTYSCAYFKEEGITLQKAQIEKYDRLCQLLKLKNTDHVLEIGSGWGGNAIHMAQHYGCKVTSVTISEEQHKYAVEKVADENLQDKVEIKLIDYRKIEGQFDKIVSIEMLEAVGHNYLDVYFKKCSELLNKDGTLALQVITCPDSRYDSLRKGVDWIQKHIFPGSLLPSVSAINRSINNTSNLTLVDLRDFGLNYAQTLVAWREEFNKNIDEIKKLGFTDTFIRKWNYYFGYCEAAFTMRNINVMQMIYTRPNNLNF